MPEYIKREAVIDLITRRYENPEICTQEINSIPAADVAPVVRCEDCKHLCVWNRKDIYAFCPKTSIVFLPFDKDTRTFFCSCGERKDEANES